MSGDMMVAMIIWSLGAVCLGLAVFGGSNLKPQEHLHSWDSSGRFHAGTWVYEKSPRLYIVLQRIQFVFYFFCCVGIGIAILIYGN